MADGAAGRFVDEVVALLGAGGVMHLLDRFFLLRKDKADADKTAAEGDSTVAAAWEKHADALNAELASLRTMVEDLWAKRRMCEEALAQTSSEIIQLKATLSSISRRADLRHGTPPEP